jgi:hypothetical protein
VPVQSSQSRGRPKVEIRSSIGSDTGSMGVRGWFFKDDFARTVLTGQLCKDGTLMLAL